MVIARDIATTRRLVSQARRAGLRVGFVPTMGALHAGHRALIDTARQAGGFVVVSIFVNPTQFGPQEDFERYPREEQRDAQLCEDAGVDLIFLPTVDAIYRPDATTRVHVSHLSETLCGLSRPGHFDGVALIVTKLLNIVLPDAAYFGQKDAQQLAIIRRLARDLDLPVEIVGCPTVREPDGLALSSRNAYLSSEARQRALCISQALRAAERLVQGGERDAREIERTMTGVVERGQPDSIDYISVVDAESLQPITRIERDALAAIALRIGPTRLIDNVVLRPPAAPGPMRS